MQVPPLGNVRTPPLPGEQVYPPPWRWLMAMLQSERTAQVYRFHPATEARAAFFEIICHRCDSFIRSTRVESLLRLYFEGGWQMCISDGRGRRFVHRCGRCCLFEVRGDRGRPGAAPGGGRCAGGTGGAGPLL